MRASSKTYIDQCVGERELHALVGLAIDEEQRFFERNRHLVEPYRDRLMVAALCQGAALQYLGIGYGVHDFDIHFFYRQNPAKPRLSRTVRRIIVDVGAFHAVPVDFIRTVVPARLCERGPQEPQNLLRAFLKRAPTANARHLAEKAVVGLTPTRFFKHVVWKPGCLTTGCS